MILHFCRPAVCVPETIAAQDRDFLKRPESSTAWVIQRLLASLSISSALAASQISTWWLLMSTGHGIFQRSRLGADSGGRRRRFNEVGLQLSRMGVSRFRS